MFQSITFYIGGKTLGIYGEEFPLGALTTEVLNITPAEYQALTDCSVYEISRHDIIECWETNMETQRLGRYVAENLYEMVYERLLDSYCTPEIRYQRLMKRCPDLKDTVPLKSIASFLGVTPETVSRIRRKLEK